MKRLATYVVRAGVVAIALGVGAATGGMGVASAALGTVKWFNNSKGFGYIAADDGGIDVFVHVSAINMNGANSVSEGLRVSYEVTYGANGRVSASNLQCASSCQFDPRVNRVVNSAAATAKQAATAKGASPRAAR